jgi:hypothetical protein
VLKDLNHKIHEHSEDEMKNWLLPLSLAALLPCACFGNNIVANPGFETGDLTAWTTDDWPAVNTAGGLVPHSGSYLADSACEGSVCLNPATGAYLYQDLSTTTGTAYTISFWYDMGDTVCVGCASAFAELRVQWGSTIIFDTTANDQPDAGWVNFTITETATSGSMELEFLGRQDPGFLGIDDVCVDVAGGACGSSSAVPEPTSLLLSGASLAGFALVALKRAGGVRC